MLKLVGPARLRLPFAMLLVVACAHDDGGEGEGEGEGGGDGADGGYGDGNGDGNGDGGGDGGDAGEGEGERLDSGLTANLSLDGHPHTFDVYVPTEAPRAAIVYLHGGGGTKEGAGQALGLGPGGGAGLDELDKLGVAWIAPQGQQVAEGVPTWENHVMTSGADDVAFLTALAAWSRTNLGVGRLALAGHSNGGMMAHRIWCEAEEAFDRYFAVAGPPSAGYDPDGGGLPCSGSRPFATIVGDADGVLRTADAMDAATWEIAPLLQRQQESAFVDGTLMASPRAHAQLRAPGICGQADEAEPTVGDRITVWSACDGDARLEVIASQQDRGPLRGHSVPDLESDGELSIAARIAEWALGGASGGDGFTFRQRRPAECGLGARRCTQVWPGAEDGRLFRYESVERFRGVEQVRTFLTYEPARLAEPGPLLIFFHGGFGSGEKMLGQAMDELADGRPVAWRPNTDDCHYTHGSGYAHPDTGAECAPPRSIVRGEQPFTLALPDGLLDVDSDTGRHWEDGRSPSPGGGGEDDERRDDVGFAAHVVETLLQRRDSPIDPERIYVLGTSNGGMMAQRVACHVGDPAYPALSGVAAVGISVAAMPANIADGAEGRARCFAAGELAVPVAYVVGRGIPTPSCAEYPCEEPVTDGDGRMPYGPLDERHPVYSPELGLVLSHEASRSRFVRQAAGVTGGRPEQVVAPLGFYAEHVRIAIGDNLRVEAFISEGGDHGAGGVRMDLHGLARLWDFVGQYRRLPGGEVQRLPEAPRVSGRI